MSRLISKTGWTIKYRDSEQATPDGDGRTCPATNAIDGNPTTIWHSKYENPDFTRSEDPQPHEIQIDMGSVHTITALRYLPRQIVTVEINGTPGQYEFYVSMDGINWDTPVASGTWYLNIDFSDTDRSEKEIIITPKTGRYIRFRTLSEINGRAWASAAEISALEPETCSDLNTNLTITKI